MPVPAILVSIQIGQPQTYGSEDASDPHDRLWTTGFFKAPVDGPVYVGTAGLHGDGHGDTANHGGADKAVLAYSADHYGRWRSELERADVGYGGFGENLTIAGLTEKDVCIGDVYAAAECRFEVSQPRQPCWKMARRWRMHELPARVIENGRTGWYLRVLAPGHLESGFDVTLLARPNPDWPISRANYIFHRCEHDLALTRQLAGVPGLSAAWVRALQRRIDRAASSS